MKLSDFKYRVPEKYIAQYPSKKRGDSRMMVLHRDSQKIEERHFKHILSYLREGDCLVVNETKVFPARLKGIKDKTQAVVEIFLLRELEKDLWEVLVRPARKVRVGNKLNVGGHLNCEVVDNTISGGRVVRFSYEGDFNEIIDKIGKVPLPPYIKRESKNIDKQRYQSIFANKRGAVAAPTAALHFDKKIVKKIEHMDVKIAPVVLHVGLGTFRPIVVEDLTRHKMDSEYYEVSPESADIINKSIDKGGRIVAIGTTVVRVLESVVITNGHVKPNSGWTDKFIYPPYDFRIVDILLTNFHMPASTLLMLVCAFGGRDLVFKAYRKAIREKYRFFSYGDAMLIL
ncbi:tRNA preQ1(34) S-adenosylmethionine ribosyltransferase-isomerase QueA [bacterium]|nr:tRNA preQ1(34) S-adenosylmethionine ribosyltransferase-isomerase QueA [bacterium]RQV94359.1 MAG: tRNA preQ1(34) S-adenosylmethionine ribosyltransferase-isomerase QueA [bacterium]